MTANALESFLWGNRKVTVVDLSDHLSNATAAFEPMKHEIRYEDHRDTIKISEERFGLGAEYWRNGLGWSQEVVTLNTHSGTHIDAPYHYAPESGGAPAKRIDEIPLRWVMGDGVVLNMVGLNIVRGIRAEDIERELARIDYSLKPYDIALIRTDAWKRFKEPGYDQKHVGLREDATRYLVERGVKLIGIDAWGFDRPLEIMIREAKAGNKHQLWESHYFGAEQEYCQIEKLCHLDALPQPFGFKVFALPVKLEKASAGWSRVIALFEEPAEAAA